ncbi:Peroxisome biogenesis factor 10 [Spathaspora sp. JA1]|nr:Peroxisome biogenesis factor 10 [Spathaspora sp. JA1]
MSSNTNNRQLPFADAATIVRAHQKDAYFESKYRTYIQDLFQILHGQRFINNYPQEITVLAKALYLSLTTLLGARTLGEEYVDLIYVNKTGKRLPKLLPRLGFILSYALLPYLISKIVKFFKSSEEEEDKKDDGVNIKNWLIRVFSNYYKVLDIFLNVHIALFYFKGEFYSVSKRIFGLRYAFGHNKDPQKVQQQSGNYSLLGGIILLQLFVKSLMGLKSYNDELIKTTDPQEEEEAHDSTKIHDIKTLKLLSENFETSHIVDLSDETQLPYLPENSRNCMLCLSPMVNPSAANCGHLFCWDCIVDWIREHPECPLCRQQCLEQNLLPLR